MKPRFPWFVLFSLLTAVSSPLGALELWGVRFDGLDVQGGVTWITNTVADSAPDPVVNSLGIGLPLRLRDGLWFRPEVWAYFQTYAYQNRRPVPVEAMFDAVLMMALVLNPVVGYSFSPFENISLEAEAGLGFVNRFVLFSWGAEGERTLDQMGWFFSDGRFLAPNLGIGTAWRWSEVFSIVLRQQVYFPVAALWGALEPGDQWMLNTSVAVRVVF